MMLMDYDAKLCLPDKTNKTKTEKNDQENESHESQERVLEIGKMFCDKYFSVFEELSK